MGLCALYYVEYRLYNVKKSGIFLSGLELHFKVSSKWLLKNKSDNGKLLLGKTYSGERFRAILALLFVFVCVFWVLH